MLAMSVEEPLAIEEEEPRKAKVNTTKQTSHQCKKCDLLMGHCEYIFLN